MRNFLCLSLVASLISCPIVSEAKWRPISNGALIREADVIAIIDVTDTEDIPRDPTKHYSVEAGMAQRISADLVEIIVGSTSDKITFTAGSIYTRVGKARYLVFLRRAAGDKTKLYGFRDQSFHPVSNEHVSWSQHWAPIADVLAEIRATLATPSKK